MCVDQLGSQWYSIGSELVERAGVSRASQFHHSSFQNLVASKSIFSLDTRLHLSPTPHSNLQGDKNTILQNKIFLFFATPFSEIIS